MQIWVYGNSFESFLVGIVVPEKGVLEDWAATNGVSGEAFQSLCKNKKAIAHVLDELDKTASAQQVQSITKEYYITIIIIIIIIIMIFVEQLKGFERVKAIHLEPNLFDMERDLITPTFKLKRPQLLKHYQVLSFSLKSLVTSVSLNL